MTDKGLITAAMLALALAVCGDGAQQPDGAEGCEQCCK